MNYLDVRLKAGEVWRYDSLEGHDRGLGLRVRGRASVSEPITPGELVLFAKGVYSYGGPARAHELRLLPAGRVQPLHVGAVTSTRTEPRSTRTSARSTPPQLPGVGTAFPSGAREAEICIRPGMQSLRT